MKSDEIGIQKDECPECHGMGLVQIFSENETKRENETKEENDEDSFEGRVAASSIFACPT